MSDFVEIEIPNKPFDKECKDVIKDIIDNKISSITDINKKFNEYHEKYFKVILSSEVMYRFNFKTDTYIEDNKKYLKDYIKKTQIKFNVLDKDNEVHTITIKPYTIFEDYITNNGWEIDYRKNKPQLYKEIYNKNGYEIETKYINNVPRIPLYLKENQKPYEEYEEKYKLWVSKIFEMMKYNLCSNNERDFEYMKNWFIRKALMKRNETAVVLQSTYQGIGKTTFSTILYYLFNENDSLVEISHHCTWLKEKFNTQLKGKVLMSIEELPRLNTSDWHDASEKLKDYITNSKTTLEGKGTNCEGGAPLFVDFVITSNGFHVPLEGNDRRYFVPTVLDGAQDDKANKLIHEVNAIIKNDDNLSNKELKEYYRCLYAYCVENYDEKFNIRKVPVTDMLIKNNDQKMNLVYKYIKEFYLKSTNNIIKDEKTGEYYYKIFMKHLSEDLTKFVENVKKNPELLKKYNYSENKYNEFLRLNNKIDSCVVSKPLRNIFENEYFKIERKQENKNNVYLMVSYNELLDKFKGKELVSNEEYEELKEKIKEVNKKENENNDNEEDNDNEELLYHKDIYGIYNELKNEFDEIKSENEKLKEMLKENISDIEMKNKEIEKIKKELESKEPIKQEPIIKEPIKEKLEVLYKQNKKYIQDNYDMTYEIKHYEDILESVKKLITCKVNKEKFDKIIKKPIAKDIEMIGKQEKQEKDLEKIYCEINDLII